MSLAGRSTGALACRGAEAWRAEAARGRLHPVVAPLHAGDLSLHDDEEGVAGFSLLDQHGTILEVLRFEHSGDGSPLAAGKRAENRERSLRQRPQLFICQYMNPKRRVWHLPGHAFQLIGFM